MFQFARYDKERQDAGKDILVAQISTWLRIIHDQESSREAVDDALVQLKRISASLGVEEGFRG